MALSSVLGSFLRTNCSVQCWKRSSFRKGISLQLEWHGISFKKWKRSPPRCFSIPYINSFCLLEKATNINMTNPHPSLSAQHYYCCHSIGTIFFFFLKLPCSIACTSYSTAFIGLFLSTVLNLSSRTSHSSPDVAAYTVQQPVSIKILAAKITFLPSNHIGFHSQYFHQLTFLLHIHSFYISLQEFK